MFKKEFEKIKKEIEKLLPFKMELEFNSQEDYPIIDCIDYFVEQEVSFKKGVYEHIIKYTRTNKKYKQKKPYEGLYITIIEENGDIKTNISKL